MKTLIFSDTHLSHKFDKSRFNHIAKIINDSDRVIINGDFWDNMLTSFDKFINSKWSELFPLLKSKDTVYIYGNHDRANWMDERVELFSTKQTEEYRFESGKNCFIVQHGHQIAPTMEENLKTALRSKLFISVLRMIHPYVDYEKFGVKFWGKNFLYNGINFKHVQKYLQFCEEMLQTNEFLVCSHSHYQILDEIKKLLNIGLINYNLSQYAIIEDDKIHLIDEKY